MPSNYRTYTTDRTPYIHSHRLITYTTASQTYYTNSLKYTVDISIYHSPLLSTPDCSTISPPHHHTRLLLSHSPSRPPNNASSTPQPPACPTDTPPRSMPTDISVTGTRLFRSSRVLVHHARSSAFALSLHSIS